MESCLVLQNVSMKGVWEFMYRPSRDKQRSSDDEGARKFTEGIREDSVGLDQLLKGNKCSN